MTEESVSFHNVFVTFDLGTPLDIERIYRGLDRATYDAEISPFVEIKDDYLGLFFRISGTGSIICLGARNVSSAKIGFRKLAAAIAKALGTRIPKPEVHVDNYVATTKYDKKLRLRKASYLLRDSNYDVKFSALRVALKGVPASFQLL